MIKTIERIIKQGHETLIEPIKKIYEAHLEIEKIIAENPVLTTDNKKRIKELLEVK